MAAGLRDLLALQGVIPLSAVVSTATPGLTVGQASGVWIGGATTSTAVPGLTLGQASGVWITGSVTPTGSPGLTLLQANGVWITGATLTEVIPESGIIGGSRGIHERHRLDDEEVLILVTMAFIEMMK